MSRTRGALRPRGERDQNGSHHTEELDVAKYLMLKHYRGQKPLDCAPMSEWTPDEVSAHIKYMQDFAAKLASTGEFVSSDGLAEDGMWVRYDGEGRPPVTDGPFAETKDLIAGWMIVDVEDERRAIELAGELSAAPGPNGEPIREWLELRPVMSEPPIITE